MSFFDDIGSGVRAARNAEGLTQGELAARAGVSERLVRSLEKGQAKGVQLDKLLSILNTLELDLSVGTREIVEHVPTASEQKYEELLRASVAPWFGEEALYAGKA